MNTLQLDDGFEKSLDRVDCKVSLRELLILRMYKIVLWIFQMCITDTAHDKHGLGIRRLLQIMVLQKVAALSRFSIPGRCQFDVWFEASASSIFSQHVPCADKSGSQSALWGGHSLLGCPSQNRRKCTSPTSLFVVVSVLTNSFVCLDIRVSGQV